MFHNIRLPENIERGAEGGPRFKTSVIILSSGKEQRNVEWVKSRGEWDIGYSVQTSVEYQEILNFFYNRRGRAYGFRFKDWSDYKTVDAPLGNVVITGVDGVTGDSIYATRDFQLIKRYSDFGTPYDRTITKPVEVSLIVKVAGVVVTHTVSPEGVVTIPNKQTPPYTQDDAVTATFEFDVPVRFDIDNLDINLEWIELGNISGINIVEIK